MNPVLRDAVVQMVPYGSRVLDLGCGDGAMLAYLQQQHGCSGYGVEIDDANVLACVKRGVEVVQLNLDQGLSMFDDQSFDVVLQIDTLQHLRNAQTMLVETVRVGRMGIVTFPNFAHWPNRLSGTTRPISGWAHLQTFSAWRKKTSCISKTHLVYKTTAWCVAGPTSEPQLLCSNCLL